MLTIFVFTLRTTKPYGIIVKWPQIVPQAAHGTHNGNGDNSNGDNVFQLQSATGLHQHETEWPDVAYGESIAYPI